MVLIKEAALGGLGKGSLYNHCPEGLKFLQKRDFGLPEASPLPEANIAQIQGFAGIWSVPK